MASIRDPLFSSTQAESVTMIPDLARLICLGTNLHRLRTHGFLFSTRLEVLLPPLNTHFERRSSLIRGANAASIAPTKYGESWKLDSNPHTVISRTLIRVTLSQSNSAGSVGTLRFIGDEWKQSTGPRVYSRRGNSGTRDGGDFAHSDLRIVTCRTKNELQCDRANSVK